MADEGKLDQALKDVNPERRALLKKLVLSAVFSIPIVLSFAVKDLARAQVGSPPVSPPPPPP